MEIRLATLDDIDGIIEVYDSARNFMSQTGNPTQWKNGYPNKELLIEDIEKKELYVCVENNVLMAVFCFFVGEDSTYRIIYDGQWLNDKPYGVIHRIAVAVHQRGVASFCINWCYEKVGNMKIDTHKDNIPMQKAILKNGFEYCGIIKKEDGTQRLAYQRA